MGRVFALGVTLLALCLLASLTPSSSTRTAVADFTGSAFALPVDRAAAQAPLVDERPSVPSSPSFGANRNGRARQLEQRARSASVRDIEAEPDASVADAQRQPSTPAQSVATPSAPVAAPLAPSQVAPRIADSTLDPSIGRQKFAALPVPRVVLSARQEMSDALASAVRAPSAASVASAAGAKRPSSGPTAHGSKHRLAVALEPAAVSEMRPAAKLVRISLSKEGYEPESPALATSMSKGDARPAPKPLAEKARSIADKPVSAKPAVRKPVLAETPQRPAPRRVAQAHAAPSYLGGSAKRTATSQFVPTSSSASASSYRSGLWQRVTFEGQ